MFHRFPKFKKEKGWASPSQFGYHKHWDNSTHVETEVRHTVGLDKPTSMCLTHSCGKTGQNGSKKNK